MAAALDRRVRLAGRPRDGGLQGPSPRTDFIGGAYNRAGSAFWAGVVEQTSPPDSNNEQGTTGYVGRLVFSSTTPRKL